MKVVVLGGTGMLGNAVVKYFEACPEYDIYTSFRNENVKLGTNTFYFDPLVNDTWKNIPTDADYILNCIGTIKPFMANNLRNSIYINSVFPHDLAQQYNNVIHITTDCVFSGKTGKYDETSLHDALDEYGKSKSLGECPKHAMVLRTSIIGEEIHKNASLIEWAKSQRGKTVQGFTHHLWNGITTHQYAKVCDTIIRQKLYAKGLFHIHAKDTVNKYELLQIINAIFELNLTVNATNSIGSPCDRSLTTIYDLSAKLDIPTISDMLRQLKK